MEATIDYCVCVMKVLDRIHCWIIARSKSDEYPKGSKGVNSVEIAEYVNVNINVNVSSRKIEDEMAFPW